MKTNSILAGCLRCRDVVQAREGNVIDIAKAKRGRPEGTMDGVNKCSLGTRGTPPSSNLNVKKAKNTQGVKIQHDKQGQKRQGEDKSDPERWQR